MQSRSLVSVLPLALCSVVACAHMETTSTSPAVQPFDQSPSIDVAPLNTKLTPEELTAACLDAEKVADARLATIASDTTHDFEHTFDAFEQAMADYGDATTRLSFLKEIHPDAKVREAAAACEEEAGKYSVKVGARKDLYLALKAAGDAGARDAVDHRLITLTMRDFKRNGLELADADREKLVALRQELTTLGTEYSANLDEDKTSFEAKEEALVGLPATFIEAHLKDKDAKGPGRTVVLTTKYPDFYPVMENAKNEALRMQMWLAFESRQAAKNLPLLTKAVTLRDEAARLLGYPTHADFVTEDRMARDAKTVRAFLDRLRTALIPARDTLNKEMLALKLAETGNAKARIESWDWRYYLNQIKKQKYSIDNEEVRQYFPADKVMAGMFQVYSTLLGVKFNEVPGVDVWADGVKLYEIRDGLDGKGKLLARFYVDMFPREGKYGHAASFTLGLARAAPKGYQIPLSALVVNFNPPRNGQAARLSFQEVDVLFHEFGHIMHQSLTTARYASESGTNVSIDFVEAPSQMLENWVYQPEILALLTDDPKNPGHPMPEELAHRLQRARTFDAGVRYIRQVYLATFDLTLHTSGPNVDPDAVEHRIYGELMGYPLHAESHTAASFGHLMGGYDAGYYGYLWSEVFADDMFSRFEREGLLNSATGKAYRDIILARGRELEPMELLEQFLGRKPNEDAFLRLTGIKAE